MWAAHEWSDKSISSSLSLVEGSEGVLKCAKKKCFSKAPEIKNKVKLTIIAHRRGLAIWHISPAATAGRFNTIFSKMSSRLRLREKMYYGKISNIFYKLPLVFFEACQKTLGLCTSCINNTLFLLTLEILCNNSRFLVATLMLLDSTHSVFCSATANLLSYTDCAMSFTEW